MDIKPETKDLKIEELFCGVMSEETLQPCKLDAFSLITVEEHGAVLCVCEHHALEIFVSGMPVIIQESNKEESKRYFGVEFPPQPETTLEVG